MATAAIVTWMSSWREVVVGSAAMIMLGIPRNCRRGEEGEGQRVAVCDQHMRHHKEWWWRSLWRVN